MNFDKLRSLVTEIYDIDDNYNREKLIFDISCEIDNIEFEKEKIERGVCTLESAYVEITNNAICGIVGDGEDCIGCDFESICGA